jgi:putative transposase
MHGDVKESAKDALRKRCECKCVETVEGAVCAGNVRLCAKIPPRLGVAEFMGCLKVKSALTLFERFPEHRRGGRNYWREEIMLIQPERTSSKSGSNIVDQTKKGKLEDRMQQKPRLGR